MFDSVAPIYENKTFREDVVERSYSLGIIFSTLESQGFGNPQRGFGLMRHAPRYQSTSWETSAFYRWYWGGSVFGMTAETGLRIHDVNTRMGVDPAVGLYVYPFALSARSLYFADGMGLTRPEFTLGVIIKG